MKAELTEAQALRMIAICGIWDVCRGREAHRDVVAEVAEIVRIIREELAKEEA